MPKAVLIALIRMILSAVWPRSPRNHSPQNARKMQNRLAQREFRARRLEHIKELEARVEFLSKPQSEQTEILVAIIHGEFGLTSDLRSTCGIASPPELRGECPISLGLPYADAEVHITH